MNQVQAAFTDIELCAYLDGELATERRVDLEAWLARQPAARAKLETWRRQGHMMRASFGRIAQEPLPRQMTAALLQQTEPVKVATILKPTPLAVAPAGEPALLAPPAPAARHSTWRNIAIVILAVASVTGLIASGLLRKISGEAEPQSQAIASAAPGFGLTRHALEAHTAFAPRADKLMDVRSADPAVLTGAAVQAGLDARLPGAVPGLRTLGLRLTPGDAGMAGLMLFDADKQGPVSLYVTRGSRAAMAGLVVRETNGLTIVSFSVEATAYALTGGAPRDLMVDWASALRLSLVQPRSLRGS
ncbi:MAG: anti-sigma factor [Hyphomicrobiales bacterium]|jgi:anti-sigma factor RsiW|nr:anti-sigma factor [Hyphomicrobiales bacterium]